MEGTLLYLDRAADKAVKDRMANPQNFLGSDPAVRKRHAGIEYIDSAAVDARVMQFEIYQQDAADLRQHLQAHGITALAVLPKTAWDALAAEAKLFRFQPADDGSVPASASMLANIEAQAHDRIAAFGFASMGGGALVLGIPALLLSNSLFLFVPTIVITALAVVIGIFAGGALFKRFTHGADSKPLASLVAKTEQKLINTAFNKPDEQLMRRLWPQDLQGPTVPLKIQMPPAPLEAQQNLERAAKAGLELHLYAAAEAIGFTEDPAQTFIGHRAPHWKSLALNQQRAAEEAARRAELLRRERERLRAERALRWDPIVTTDHASATAIFVQYGDFPLEKEVIDRVMASPDLL